jgi:hypothetical protein
MQSSLLTGIEIWQRSHGKILVGLFELKDMLSSFLTHTLFKKRAACTFLSGSGLWLIWRIFSQEQTIYYVLWGSNTTVFNAQRLAESFRKKFSIRKSVGRLIKLNDSMFFRIYCWQLDFK